MERDNYVLEGCKEDQGADLILTIQQVQQHLMNYTIKLNQLLAQHGAQIATETTLPQPPTSPESEIIHPGQQPPPAAPTILRMGTAEDGSLSDLQNLKESSRRVELHLPSDSDLESEEEEEEEDASWPESDGTPAESDD